MIRLLVTWMLAVVLVGLADDVLQLDKDLPLWRFVLGMGLVSVAALMWWTASGGESQ
jgi:hypothetical protein